MRQLLSLCLLIAFAAPCIAQTDTTYLYFDKGWKECGKDTAFYYGKVYKHGDLWERKDYWVAGDKLQMEAICIDKDCQTREGKSSWYRENGTLASTSTYIGGKALTADYFYESGKKKGHIDYTKDGDKQQGWDEAGNEIPGYVVEREARFPGGLPGWRSYLEANLDAGVAARSKAKIGNYTVGVQFIVDKEGNISNVHAIQVPADCKRCEKEAVRVIKNGPNWEPAMQDNKKVIYQAIQYITFQVAEQ